MASFADHATGRDNNFNLLRMVAATAVLVSHAWPIALGEGTIEPMQGELGIKLGTAAVYIFFAISGFFIARSFDQGNSVKRFLKARLLRLFPGLSTALILTVLVAWLTLPHGPAADYWLSAPIYVLRNMSLYFLQYGLPGVFENTPLPNVINGSLWTLFYEVACYGGVLVLGLLGLLRIRRLIGIGALAFFVLAIFRHDLHLPGRVNTLVELGLPFVLGVFAYVWRARIPVSPALGAIFILDAIMTRGTILFPVFFVLALSYWSLVLGFLKIPALLAYNRLGDYSYGMYIYAFPVQQMVAQFGVRDPLQNILIALPVTLSLAVLSWHLVERPSLHMVKHTA